MQHIFLKKININLRGAASISNSILLRRQETRHPLFKEKFPRMRKDTLVKISAICTTVRAAVLAEAIGTPLASDRG